MERQMSESQFSWLPSCRQLYNQYPIFFSSSRDDFGYELDSEEYIVQSRHNENVNIIQTQVNHKNNKKRLVIQILKKKSTDIVDHKKSKLMKKR